MHRGRCGLWRSADVRASRCATRCVCGGWREFFSAAEETTWRRHVDALYLHLYPTITAGGGGGCGFFLPSMAIVLVDLLVDMPHRRAGPRRSISS